MSAEMEREKRAVWQFLGLAVDQEHQAVLEGERDDKSYAKYLEDSGLQSDSTGMTLKLKTGRSFRIVIL